jgi:hypothetical protein
MTLDKVAIARLEGKRRKLRGDGEDPVERVTSGL